jgi:eukaryotic-like serine/threonine-protein kinase
VDSKERVLDGVGKGVSRLREKLGESLASIQKFDKPLREATTSSLEALKEFSAGSQKMREGREPEAIPHFRHASELDPNFALAYSVLAVVYSNFGESEKGSTYEQKAYALRDRVSEREKLTITRGYYWMVTGDLDQEMEAEELARQEYPRDASAPNDLAFNYLHYLGQFEKAVALADQSGQINPGGSGSEGFSIYAPAIQAEAYLALDRMDEAKAVLDRALANKVDNSSLHEDLYEIALLQGNAEALRREEEWSKTRPAQDDLSDQIIPAAAQRGQFKKAQSLTEQWLQALHPGGFDEIGAASLASLVLAEAEVGSYAQAHADAVSSTRLFRSRTNLPIAALAFALGNDTKGTESVIAHVNARYPSDNSAQHVYIPVARAVLEINRGNPEKAVEGLEATRRQEWGHDYQFLPPYVRGFAYLRAQQGRTAVAEFEGIVKHRGNLAHAPEWALAHVGLARAYGMAGDSSQARKAYQDFFALWKDADPDVPILKQAKAEYAKLQ